MISFKTIKQILFIYFHYILKFILLMWIYIMTLYFDHVSSNTIKLVGKKVMTRGQHMSPTCLSWQVYHALHCIIESNMYNLFYHLKFVKFIRFSFL